MAYFLIMDLGYDGEMIIQFEKEESAQSKYTETEGAIKNGYVEGVALIKGELIKSHKLDIDKWV